MSSLAWCQCLWQGQADGDMQRRDAPEAHMNRLGMCARPVLKTSPAAGLHATPKESHLHGQGPARERPLPGIPQLWRKLHVLEEHV